MTTLDPSCLPDTVFDVVVVGRGPVGAAAALALAQSGCRVAILGEAAPADDGGWDPRIYALSPGSRALLARVKVWDALDAARIAPVYDMRIYPSLAEDAPELHFDAYEARVEALAWIVEGRNLAATFARALSFSSVVCVPGQLAQMTTDAPEGARLTLADGVTVRAKLVVGADGAASPVRQLSGLAHVERPYPQTAVVANFETGLPHRDGAWQWFGEHGILALLPLPGQRCGIVWSAPHALAAELRALPAQALAERVEQVSRGTLGRLVPLTPAESFPLRRIDVASMIARRVALVGDAAHVVHPLAGQGMNLGFADVSALVAVLAGRERFRDLADPLLLRRYERARKEAVASMRLATDGLQRLFDADTVRALGPFGAPMARLRDAGWRAVAASGWLRRRLAGAAAA